MRNLKFLLSTLLVFAGVACSSNKPASGPSDDEVRARAKKAYSEIDGNSAPKASSTPKAVSSNATKNSSVVANLTQEQNIINPVIMVMPANSGKGSSVSNVIDNNPYSKATMEGINEYLTKKQYDVKSIEGSNDLDDVIQMQNDIAGTEEDMSYLASLAFNADIYIKFSGAIDSKGFVIVDLNAYESSTARLLASQSSTVDSHGRLSAIDTRANLKTAAKKAMVGLEAKLQAYWQEDLKKGIQYKVIMNIKGEFTDNQIEDLHDDVVQTLKKQFNKITVNALTAQTIDLVIYANPNQQEDAQAVYSEIRRSLKNFAESKKINVSKKLIIMDLR